MDSLASARRISSLPWDAYPCLPDKTLRVRATAIQPHAALVDGHEIAAVQCLDDILNSWRSAGFWKQVRLVLGHAGAGQL